MSEASSRSQTSSPMIVAALVSAAGMGLRLGGDTPKGLRVVGSAPLLVHAAQRMAAAPSVIMLVVAAPPGLVDQVREMLAAPGLFPSEVAVVVVAGGVLRQDSVRLMLDALPADITHVLIHDAARPFTPTSVAAEVCAALAAGSVAVIPVVPVVDTVKRVDATSGDVVETVPRAELRLVQTPQGFDRAILRRAHREAPSGWEATDDASMVEHMGLVVHTVPGDRRAMKITTPEDILVIEALIAGHEQ